MRSRGIVLLSLLLVTLAMPAAAQEREEANGSADFRLAPVLAPGSYNDRIVAGESVWYGVLYTNYTMMRVVSQLEDVDVAQDDDLTLTASLHRPDLKRVGPDNLQSFQTDPDTTFYGEDGVTATNLWFVRIALHTTGERGVLHTLNLDVEGALATGFEECGEGCDVRADLIDAQEELAELQALTRDPELLDEGAVRGRMDDFENTISRATTEAGDAVEQIADLCAPNPTCEVLPEPRSRTWIWVLAGIVLIGGVGLLTFRLRS